MEKLDIDKAPKDKNLNPESELWYGLANDLADIPEGEKLKSIFESMAGPEGDLRGFTHPSNAAIEALVNEFDQKTGGQHKDLVQKIRKILSETSGM